jgi:hypothetical protein
VGVPYTGVRPEGPRQSVQALLVSQSQVDKAKVAITALILPLVVPGVAVHSVAGDLLRLLAQDLAHRLIPGEGVQAGLGMLVQP